MSGHTRWVSRRRTRRDEQPSPVLQQDMDTHPGMHVCYACEVTWYGTPVCWFCCSGTDCHCFEVPDVH